jgi:tetratricopeptide (TPR) repeat protein
MRNHEEANRYYDLAIKLAPDYPQPHYFKARHYLRLAGDTAKARTVIETAQRLGLANEPWITYSRALLDLFDGAFHEAVTRLSSESWEALEYEYPSFHPLLQSSPALSANWSQAAAAGPRSPITPGGPLRSL